MRRDRGGFTLIEVLIVVVIIGILAVIAFPNYASSKEQAYVSQLKGDLRRLSDAQESYLFDQGTYYAGAVPAAGLMYEPSQGVQITVVNAGASGWSAVAEIPGRSTRRCDIYYGSAGSAGVATVEGQVACT
jgi:prepilin-type N-terminal cleavage/methylation domain-containing protein